MQRASRRDGDIRIATGTSLMYDQEDDIRAGENDGHTTRLERDP
ncbi:MAG: hypothetical protein WC342_09860 [Methanoregula sp.]